MLAPASRLIELLELLQDRPVATGTEIAGRLGIDGRTVRRYIEALQALGVPVEGQRGVGGGYRLRPGYRLPPLMLNDAEAVAVVVGLAVTRQQGTAADADAIESAVAKINRVLPAPLRRRAEALERTLAFTGSPTSGRPPASEVALGIAEAIRRQKRLGFRYRTHAGDEARRDVSPFGLVVHSSRWYLPALDHGRAELRTFRVDRMTRVSLREEAAAAPPNDFDAVAHVSRALASVPWQWEVEVLLDLPVDRAADRIPATLGELVETPEGTLVRMRVSSLDWMARVLAGLDCAFTIRRPKELRTSVRALAARLRAAAAAPPR